MNPTANTERNELYHALNLCHRAALADIAAHNNELANPVLLRGWTLERHERYHNEWLEVARHAEKWLFVHMMQINPD